MNAAADPRDLALIAYFAVEMVLRALARTLLTETPAEQPLLLVGPPGSGKTMLAHRMAESMPALDNQTRAESSMLFRLAGLDGSAEHIERGAVPFRAPHHTVSTIGLAGQATVSRETHAVRVRPGELSLAHGGLLFLDEAPEFQRSALELVAYIHRDWNVVLQGGSTIFPSRFRLVMAANPCPCGHYGSPSRACRCSDLQRERYLDRVLVPFQRAMPRVVWLTGEVR